jgi:methyltransferase
MMLAVAIGCLVFVPMLLEARRSAVNERTLRAAGAREPAGDVYPVMQVAYPLCFLLPIAEAWVRGHEWNATATTGAAVFVAAKALKYWAIATLGTRWTFRVLVPPLSTRIVAGPYRVLRHPNYVAVAGELIGVALMTRAVLSGPVAVAAFVALMLLRIRTEEQALGSRRG